MRLAALRRAMARWPSELVFLSEAEREHWVRGARGVVVPEFIDLARFTPERDGRAARERLGVPPDARVVLFLGGFWEIKGILPLIEALSIVRRQVPGLLCLMPGTDVVPGSVVALAARWLPCVTVTGRIRAAFARHGEDAWRPMPFSSDVPLLLAASDVLVFPSILDHFARPVVEAGAMGKPVVASRLPVMEEQTRGGASAVLVPPGDAAALARGVVEVLTDPVRARALGEAGRAIAVERFETRANAARMAALYDDVLGRVEAAGRGDAKLTVLGRRA